MADSTVERTTHNENTSEFIVADSPVERTTHNENTCEFVSFIDCPKLFIPKSLSVSNLTSDSLQIKKKRACSVPPSIKFQVTSSENLQVDMDSQDSQLIILQYDRSPSLYHRDTRIASESPSILTNSHLITNFDPPVTANFLNESDTDALQSSSSSYIPSSSSSDEESHNQTATTSSASQSVFFGDVNEGRQRRKIRNMNEWKKK